MQVNAPCHTAKSVKHFLLEAQNPIGDFCKLLNERAKEKNSRNVEELWTNLKGEWEKISIDERKTLIRSYSKRCQAVIESKGQHIKC